MNSAFGIRPIDIIHCSILVNWPDAQCRLFTTASECFHCPSCLNPGFRKVVLASHISTCGFSSKSRSTSSTTDVSWARDSIVPGCHTRKERYCVPPIDQALEYIVPPICSRSAVDSFSMKRMRMCCDDMHIGRTTQALSLPMLDTVTVEDSPWILDSIHRMAARGTYGDRPSSASRHRRSRFRAPSWRRILLDRGCNEPMLLCGVWGNRIHCSAFALLSGFARVLTGITRLTAPAPSTRPVTTAS